MPTTKSKNDKFCVVEKCWKLRAGRDNFRCEGHSRAYYGGHFSKEVSPRNDDGSMRKTKEMLDYE